VGFVFYSRGYVGATLFPGDPVSFCAVSFETFERYGFVEMVAGKRSKKPVAKSVDFDICIPA